MLESLTTPESWIALATLTSLEIILGIDNIIFISILAGRLPFSAQHSARRIGMIGAMCMRILLLFSLTWIMRLTQPLFAMVGHSFSGRDLILLMGGLFLIGKSTHEIHVKLEGEEAHQEATRTAASFGGVVAQMMIIDVVFSLDSVITAIGMTQSLAIMVAAVVVSVGLMLMASGWISDTVNRHPTLKMLALSFLMLIGVTLVAEGWGQHIAKGYIYGAMAFSLFVEILNLRVRTKISPVHLRSAMARPPENTT